MGTLWATGWAVIAGATTDVVAGGLVTFPEPEPPQPAITPAMQPIKIKTNLKRSLTVRSGEHSVAVIPAFSFLESDVVYDFTLCQNSRKRGL